MSEPSTRDAPVLRPAVLGWAVVAALAISFLAVVAAADGSESLAGRIGGDFPAFYGAGAIVVDGDAPELYRIERQQAAQDGLVDEGTVQYFAYPPPMAALYAPLALLPYVAAYTLHSLLMAGALIGAFLLVRPMLPARRPAGVVLAAVTFTFLPAFMAVTLGQNTALLVLLVAASWRFGRDGQDALAGVALGLLLYKPQYAVPLIGLHVVRQHWRLVASAAAVAVGWWAAGVAMLGRSWTGDWVEQVGDFTALDAEVNGANAVSWLGVSEHLLGVGSPSALVLGGGMAVLTGAALVLIWHRATDDDLALPVAAASVGILLMSPHAMFYDAGILVLTVAALASAGRERLAPIAAAGWLVGALHPLKGVVGLTPVGIVVAGAFAVVVHTWAGRGLGTGRRSRFAKC